MVNLWTFADYIWVIWGFPKIGVPQHGWFILENSLKWMIWGYRYFWKHPYLVSIQKLTSQTFAKTSTFAGVHFFFENQSTHTLRHTPTHKLDRNLSKTRGKDACMATKVMSGCPDGLNSMGCCWWEISGKYHLPWEPITFIFWGYDPYFGGAKPSFFMVLRSKGGISLYK